MKITRVHQIEITSRCNLRCKYCPHPRLERPKADMAGDVFYAALVWASNREDPAELSLTGMGEAVLHPRFPAYLRLARKILPHPTKLVVATNGVALVRGADDIIDALRSTETLVYVSTHRPEAAGRALARLAAAGVPCGTNTSFVTSSFDWAGQVDWPVTSPAYRCEYLASGWVVVLQDGSVVNCCLDAHGKHVIGRVPDDLPSEISPIPLCTDCHMIVPEDKE